MSPEIEKSRRGFVKAGIATGVGVLAAASNLSAAGSDEWGDLIGRFVYDGTPPERKKLKVEKDVA